MTVRGWTTGGVLFSLAMLGAAATATAAGVVFARRANAARAARGPAEPDTAVALLTPPEHPITSEADVFRTGPKTLAIWKFDVARRPAKPRTLHIYRTRRAYPGAPPQIPHGLTGEEFRSGACTTCHERGGYSPRFGAYVPVTPHPQMGPCLQCHVGVDGITGVTLPSIDPNTICKQCHDPNNPRANPPSEWKTTVWPALQPITPGEDPPWIPHDLQIRGNCLACHAGPAAVQEIRTTHPDRAACRDCHVAISADPPPFVRPTGPDGDPATAAR